MTRLIGRALSAYILLALSMSAPAAAQSTKIKHFGSSVPVPVSAAAKNSFGCEPADHCKNCDGTLAYQLCLLDTWYEVQRPNGNPNITMQKSKASPLVEQFKP